MKTLTIITPVLPALSRYVRAAAESVRLAKEAATLVSWQIEWIVVVDGDGDMPLIEGADKILRLPRRCGVSAARNYALAHATSEWIFPLDADDELDCAGMRTVLERLGGDEELDWIGLNRVLMDDAKTPHWKETPEKWEAGQLAEKWTAPFCFHPNTVLVRRSAALHIGGWPALPSNEDLGFVLTLSEHFAGRFMTQTMTCYRVWPQQTIADSAYKYLKYGAFEIIAASLNARRQRLGQKLIEKPVPGGAFGGFHR